MDGKPEAASNAQHLRVVQRLLWDAISQQLYPAERDEVRRALGSALLDENGALFAEAAALGDILGEVSLNTAALLARQQLCANPQRSMVETEIRLLIERLHATAVTTPFNSTAVRERDPDSLLPRGGARDRAVLDHVATSAQIAENGGRPPSAAGNLPPRPPTALSAASRPGTASRPHTSLSAPSTLFASSRPGSASPTPSSFSHNQQHLSLAGAGPSSRPSTASSAASSAATRYTDAGSVVAGVADKLSLASIDAVKEALRAALQDERAALLEDVEYLQGLLEAEADLQVRAAAPPPSIHDLRDYSQRLAAVVAGEEARVEHEVRVSAMFAAADSAPSRPLRLRGMVDASRRPPSAGGGPGAGAGGSAGGAGGGVAASLAQLTGPGRRPSGDGGGSVQRLVVVHGGEDEVSTSAVASSRVGSTRRPAAPSRSPEPAAAAGGVPSGRQVSTPPEAAGAAHRGVGLQPPLRRPPSGGAPASLLDAAPLPPVAPPACARAGSAVGALHPLGRPHSGASSSPLHAATAATDTSPLTTRSGIGIAPIAGSPARAPSPGRPLPPSAGATLGLAAPTHGSQPCSGSVTSSPSHQPGVVHRSTRDPSPVAATPGRPAVAPRAPSAAGGRAATEATAGGSSRSGGSVALGGGAAATPPHARPLSRSGSIGAPPPAPEPSSSASRSLLASLSASRHGAVGISRAAAAAHAQPAAAAESADSAAGPAPVQPRALYGNRGSVVEALEAEVDAVRGGVAAILDRYNIRPSTPGRASRPGSAGAAPAGVEVERSAERPASQGGRGSAGAGAGMGTGAAVSAGGRAGAGGAA